MGVENGPPQESPEPEDTNPEPEVQHRPSDEVFEWAMNSLRAVRDKLRDHLSKE